MLQDDEIDLWHSTPKVDILMKLPERSRDEIDRYLNLFDGKVSPSATEYEFPMYSANPDVVFSNINQALDYLVRNRNLEHCVYWSCKALGKLITPQTIFLGFTTDNALIAGATVNGELLETWYDFFVKKYEGVIYGYELYPPENLDEFDKLQKTSNLGV